MTTLVLILIFLSGVSFGAWLSIMRGWQEREYRELVQDALALREALRGYNEAVAGHYKLAVMPDPIYAAFSRAAGLLRWDE